MRVTLALALVAGLPSFAHAGTVRGLEPVVGTPWAAAIGVAIAIAAVLIICAAALWLCERVRWPALIAPAVVAFIFLGVAPALAADSDGTEPDPVLTPGAVETQDLDILCHHKTAERRHTTQSEKNAAFTAYGLANKHAGWCAGPHGCSVDHRVPLECGGADVPANLWPETGDGAYSQKDKNRLEGLCKQMICQGKITPAEGQAWFLGDWKAEYDRRFGAVEATH